MAIKEPMHGYLQEMQMRTERLADRNQRGVADTNHLLRLLETPHPMGGMDFDSAVEMLCAAAQRQYDTVMETERLLYEVREMLRYLQTFMDGLPDDTVLFSIK